MIPLVIWIILGSPMTSKEVGISGSNGALTILDTLIFYDSKANQKTRKLPDPFIILCTKKVLILRRVKRRIFSQLLLCLRKFIREKNRHFPFFSRKMGFIFFLNICITSSVSYVRMFCRFFHVIYKH